MDDEVICCIRFIGHLTIFRQPFDASAGRKHRKFSATVCLMMAWVACQVDWAWSKSSTAFFTRFEVAISFLTWRPRWRACFKFTHHRERPRHDTCSLIHSTQVILQHACSITFHNNSCYLVSSYVFTPWLPSMEQGRIDGGGPWSRFLSFTAQLQSEKPPAATNKF